MGLPACARMATTRSPTRRRRWAGGSAASAWPDTLARVTWRRRVRLDGIRVRPGCQFAAIALLENTPMLPIQQHVLSVLLGRIPT